MLNLDLTQTTKSLSPTFTLEIWVKEIHLFFVQISPVSRSIGSYVLIFGNLPTHTSLWLDLGTNLVLLYMIHSLPMGGSSWVNKGLTLDNMMLYPQILIGYHCSSAVLCRGRISACPCTSPPHKGIHAFVNVCSSFPCAFILCACLHLCTRPFTRAVSLKSRRVVANKSHRLHKGATSPCSRSNLRQQENIGSSPSLCTP